MKLNSSIHLLIFVPLALTMALSCGNSIDDRPFPTTTPLDKIVFSISDPVDQGVEGTDTVGISITEGEVTAAHFWQRRTGMLTYQKHELSAKGKTFSSNTLEFGPYSYEWFVTVQGPEVTGNIGNENQPFTTHKFLNKQSANQMIKDRMDELKAIEQGLVIQQYSTSTNVMLGSTPTTLDHYITTWATVQNEYHNNYIIEYSTALDQLSSPLRSPQTATYQQNIQQTSPTGHIIIYSTDFLSLRSLLYPDFRIQKKDTDGSFLYEY